MRRLIHKGSVWPFDHSSSLYKTAVEPGETLLWKAACINRLYIQRLLHFLDDKVRWVRGSGVTYGALALLGLRSENLNKVLQ